MKIEQVGVQLYTVRDHLETVEAYQETLQKIAEIGYKSVEIAGPRPVREDDIASMCAEKGLVICSSHEDGNLILENPAQVVEHLEEFGCRYAVYPYPGNIDMGSAAQVQALIAGLGRSGKVLAEYGKQLIYHNHDMELQLLDDLPVLEHIFTQTDPAHLQAEIDPYWVHVGDASPEAWCARMRDRLPVLHLKDCLNSGEPRFAEVGSGILDFRRIIATAEASGCQWFIVEQDICPGDPFVSLEKSYRYIYDNLVD